MLDYKIQRQVHLGKDAVFRSGIADSREMEQWHSGYNSLTNGVTLILKRRNWAGSNS